MWPWWAEEPEAGRRNGGAPADERPVALAAAGMAGVVAARQWCSDMESAGTKERKRRRWEWKKLEVEDEVGRTEEAGAEDVGHVGFGAPPVCCVPGGGGTRRNRAESTARKTEAGRMPSVWLL